MASHPLPIGTHWGLLAEEGLRCTAVIESLVRRSGGEDDAAGFQEGRAVFGLVLMSDERRWLKEHLSEIEVGTGSFGKNTERAGKRGK